MANTVLLGFRSFLTEKFTCAAVEVFEEVENLMESLYEENKRLKTVLHMVLSPQIKLSSIDISQYTTATKNVSKDSLQTSTASDCNISECLANGPKEEPIEYDINWGLEQQCELEEAEQFIPSDCLKEEDDTNMQSIMDTLNVKVVEMSPDSSSSSDDEEGHFSEEMESAKDNANISQEKKITSRSLAFQDSHETTKTTHGSRDGLTGSGDQNDESVTTGPASCSSDNEELRQQMFANDTAVVDRQTSDEDCGEEWVPDDYFASKRKRREQQESSSEEETPTPKRGRPLGIGRRGRGSSRRARRVRGGEIGDGSPQPGTSAGPSSAEERWHDTDTPDMIPPQPIFRPKNPPGPQLITTASYTPVQLFQLFFTPSVLDHIVENTNLHGSAHYNTPTSPWTDLTSSDLLSFFALIIYMGIVKCKSFSDYWRGGRLYNFPFPKSVMTRTKFLLISWAFHLSSPAAEEANEQQRGTDMHDRLSKIKPLYEEMREACRRNFHPGQDIAINERMVASKACIGLKQYMKNKPVKCGYKLFVLADSSTGYTWDFFVYEAKAKSSTGMGLSYESVMQLLDTQLLGTGYKLFVDNFYTSPALFQDLLKKRIYACGTIRTNRVGFPKTKENSLVSRSPQGSIRWMRKDSLLFLQWRDTRDVFMCSTVHTAHSGETVSRRVKDVQGQWSIKDISVPPCVKDYNRCMGGVGLSDALIGYYSVLHKTMKWYKSFFYHFMDIAIVNAYILHKALASGRGEKPLTQKAFRETLAEQLAQVCSRSATSTPPHPTSTAHHRIVFISGHRTTGRALCRQCRKKTPLKCSTCDVPLCLIPNRDCYNNWHIANNM
ncbi:piggyBac transposable element-derived protein 4-like [Pholidichthys leucotaenia]